MRHKEFLIAFVEGKRVEYRDTDSPSGGWSPVGYRNSIGLFDDPRYELRVAPRRVKVERWVVLFQTSNREPKERFFSSEAKARDEAACLRDDGYQVLAEAVHLCTEVEVEA